MSALFAAIQPHNENPEQTGIISVELDRILVPERLRPVDSAWVEVIAARFATPTGGRFPAIIVRPIDGAAQPYALVAGAHRLEAARRLGWAAIPADVQALTETQARLVEIDENLVRRELSALDRAIFLRERKRVYEELHPETKHGGKRSKIDEIAAADSPAADVSPTWRLDPDRFTKEAAERVGFSERVIQRAIALADDLSPEAVAAIRGTPFVNNQAQLLLLARENVETQVRLARAIADGKAGTVAQARVVVGIDQAVIDDPQARAMKDLISAWTKSNAATRKKFRAYQDDPKTPAPAKQGRKS